MEEAHIFMFHGKNSGESTSKLSHQDVTGKHLSPVKHEHRKHSSRSELKVDASEEWHLVGGGAGARWQRWIIQCLAAPFSF